MFSLAQVIETIHAAIYMVLSVSSLLAIHTHHQGIMYSMVLIFLPPDIHSVLVSVPTVCEEEATNPGR